MLFSLALWPVRRYAPERRALATLYAELARVAEAGAPATEAPPATAQISAAEIALQALSGDRSLEAERYLALLSQAERMRLALLVLSRLRVRIGREEAIAPHAGSVGRAIELAGEILTDVASALTSANAVVDHTDCIRELREMGDQLRTRDGIQMLHDARAQIEALAGQLRSALDLAAHVTETGAVEFERREAAQPWGLRLEGTLALLRANLHLDSAVFRHALRLTGCVVIATFAGHTLGWGRSYWMPMTVALVPQTGFHRHLQPRRFASGRGR